MLNVFPIDTEKLPVDSSWTVTVEDEKISIAELLETEEGDYYLRMLLKSKEPNTVIFTDPQGNEYRVIVSYDDNDGTRVVYKIDVSPSDAVS